MLRPGGTLVLVWNTRDRSVDWVRRFGDLLVDGDGDRPYDAYYDVDYAGRSWPRRRRCASGPWPSGRPRGSSPATPSCSSPGPRRSASWRALPDGGARRSCSTAIRDLAAHPPRPRRPADTSRFPYAHPRRSGAAGVSAGAGVGPGYELLGWWEAERRDLPWRRTRDPWAVLVSELMLQQTQVARVEPRWHRFLERFPTPAACASAGRRRGGRGVGRPRLQPPGGEPPPVRRGGGRRARRRASPTTSPSCSPCRASGPTRPGRCWPSPSSTTSPWSTPTWAASWPARPAARSAPREAQERADSLVPAGEGWAWNQAMLDLGATVCAKRSPGCERCPVAGTCAWALAGRPEPDPATGSHAVSRGQSRFEGSFRQGRSRCSTCCASERRCRRRTGRAACGWADRADAGVRRRRARSPLTAPGPGRAPRARPGHGLRTRSVGVRAGSRARSARGGARLLDVLRLGAPVAPAEWPAACGWADRADAATESARAAATLVADGLAVLDADGAPHPALISGRGSRAPAG